MGFFEAFYKSIRGTSWGNGRRAWSAADGDLIALILAQEWSIARDLEVRGIGGIKVAKGLKFGFSKAIKNMKSILECMSRN